MKKMILGVLAVVGTAASAMPVLTIRADLTVTPLPVSQQEGKTTKIRILSNGEVQGITCRIVQLPVYPPKQSEQCSSTIFTRLSFLEMQLVNQQIAQAVRGVVVPPTPGQVLCAAIPMEKLVYRAAEGRKVLKFGSFPCGGDVHYNNAPAARELEQRLDGLRHSYSQVFPSNLD